MVPLKVTVLLPGLAPKLLPAMATILPTGPEAGDRLDMLGGTVTVNGAPLLATLLTVTTTFPVVAPLGTATVMLVALQFDALPALVPLKVTVLVPWLAPNPLPAMTTAVPAGPEVGDMPEMLGGTVKGAPLLAKPLTVTITFPVVAPLGTATVMLVAFQFETLPALAPLKATVLAPWLAPKLLPVMVTAAPTAPEAGDRPEMLGGTVKGAPLLAKPLTVTTTFPVVAPLGTVTVMLPALQFDALPAPIPLKATVLAPWLAPKLLPVMVTAVPTGPEVGDRLEMLGGTVTVNSPPLLARPPTVTTTFPLVAPLGTATVMLVALQFNALPALAPLKATVLAPWLAPKLLPVMVTAVPTGPEVGDRLDMLGGTVTVNGAPLLARPPTFTTTFPLVAPLGTATVMLPALQLETAPALVPLKVTVLVPWLAPRLLPVMVTAVPTGPEAGFSAVMLGTGRIVKPFVSVSVWTPVSTVTVTAPSVAPAPMAKLATATVGLLTVTGPNAPAAAPPTAMPGPKLATVLPWKKLVFSPVMVTCTCCPAPPEAGLTEATEAEALRVTCALFPLMNVTPLSAVPERDIQYGVGVARTTLEGIWNWTRRAVPSTVTTDWARVVPLGPAPEVTGA
jgi:hypothetical protein